MISWFKSFHAQPIQPTPCHVSEEKTMIISKASPSVQTAPVSVHVDDPHSILGGNAVITLTIKLAEQTQLMDASTPLKASSYDTTKAYTRLSDLVLRQQPSMKSIRGPYQPSQLRRVAHFTKATANTKSTSVAVSGNVALDFARTSDSIMTHSTMTPAMESLSRQSIIAGIPGDGTSSFADSNSDAELFEAPKTDDPKVLDHAPREANAHPVHIAQAPSPIPSYATPTTAQVVVNAQTIPDKQLKENEVSQGLEKASPCGTNDLQEAVPIVAAPPQPKGFSWMSLFSSSPKSSLSRTSTNDTPSDTITKTDSRHSDLPELDTKPINAPIQKLKATSSIRSSSSLPTSVHPSSPLTNGPSPSPSIIHTTSTPIGSEGSVPAKKTKMRDPPGSPSPTIKKKPRSNVILPTFQSQITLPPEPPEKLEPETNSFFGKAFDAINNALTRSDSHIVDAAWWKKQAKAKFSRFLQDIKTDPSCLADKKIVVVGVHGWFPTKLVRSVIGEPTGTSQRFCEQMMTSIKCYFESKHSITLPQSAIVSIPLEGEGKVEDRVDQLYDKLTNTSAWLDAISSADVILWATHSQGTPVSIMLLHRLLERGHLHIQRQSVCMLAMAGIAHGPLPALKDSLFVKYVEADPARELFEFIDPDSDISRKFWRSLAYVLREGIKMSLVGSMQDQVVPLYSAVMSAVSHPNILRSIYIDGHIYSQDDFLINLITFSLRLRNAGLSDHHLLTHLSGVLAGNLYVLEGGHSTVYEEVNVYMTAVQYLFETEPFGKAQMVTASLPHSHTPPSPSSSSRKQQAAEAKEFLDYTNVEASLGHFRAEAQLNPNYLPWAMRGICDDSRILHDPVFGKELEKLRALFKNWNPTSAKLREVKFRLAPISTMGE